MFAMNARFFRSLPRLMVVVALSLLLAACGKDEADTGTAETAGTASPQATGEPAAPPEAVSDEVAAMSAGELREAAGTALRDQRLYAPAGDNAVEYYLALRDKQPDDPAVASALTDLMPYTLIATEQSIARGDFTEALRLYALMEKANPDAPALPRLKTSIASAQEEAARLAIEAEQRSEEEAELAAEREAELAAEREAEQEQAQREAAEALAQQQAEQRAAEQRAAEQAAAAQAAEQAQQTAATGAEETSQSSDTSSSSGATSNELIVVSTVPPEFPRRALRRRVSGEVQVEFVVGTNGSVTSARVVDSSPRNTFDNAALRAVRQWKFQPIAEPQTVRQTLTFNPGG